jgi:hypothetical protein
MNAPTVGILVFTLFAAAACARDVIPNTDVDDTSDNRRVLEFVEGYRQAVEERNVGAMLSLASAEYFDDFGTPSATDDVDFEGLRGKLGRWQDRVMDVRYEIRYRRVSWTEKRVYVDYTYTASFQIKTATGDRWARRLADNRLTLEPAEDGGDFRILSGM